MRLPSPDFESSVSANFTTPAVRQQSPVLPPFTEGLQKNNKQNLTDVIVQGKLLISQEIEIIFFD